MAYAFLAAFVSFIIFFSLWCIGYILAKRPGIGFGDLKLFVSLSLLLGVMDFVRGLYIASIASLLCVLIFSCIHRKWIKVLPFGPGLCGAGFLLFFLRLIL